ncbi:sensor histidine kinase [Pseudarthrobacter scleromae]|uniref:sensor histidine kinase n=1 Tax=Pseudarthrobacter scleromae TaxID=158897 RepID=UPI0016669AE6|nr:ATP-binding protein [Pseudarthrobacter scleromae]
MVRKPKAVTGVDFAPGPGVADLGRLAGQTEGGPRVDVELSGELDDLSPVVGAALYRLAQESVTNARRHARYATRVAVRVVGDAEHVRLTVDDDGAASTAGGGPSGDGLVGMRERARLLGGTFHAGPSAGGWRVEAMLPRAGAPR